MFYRIVEKLFVSFCKINFVDWIKTLESNLLRNYLFCEFYYVSFMLEIYTIFLKTFKIL